MPAKRGQRQGHCFFGHPEDEPKQWCCCHHPRAIQTPTPCAEGRPSSPAGGSGGRAGARPSFQASRRWRARLRLYCHVRGRCDGDTVARASPHTSRQGGAMPGPPLLAGTLRGGGSQAPTGSRAGHRRTEGPARGN